MTPEVKAVPIAPASRESALDLLRRMLDIPSPSCGEGRLAKFLVEAMEVLHFSSRIDEAGNVIGEIGRGVGPTVLLASHLDTVPGHVPVRLEGTRLFGRGASDAKGPLATMVLAAADRGRNFPGRIIVAGLVEEETPGSRGAVHLVRTIDQPDAIVVGEPAGSSSITIGYKGKLDLVYSLRCPPVHPTSPTVKASEAAVAFWHDAVRFVTDDDDPTSASSGHSAFNRLGMTLDEMRGDLESAELRFSYRTPVGFATDDLIERLRSATRGGRLEVLGRVDAVVSDRTDVVVRALSAAIRRDGGTPRLKLKSATSDMNVFARRWRVPMATFGPGDSHLDHTADEHIEVDDFLAGIRILGGALDELTRSLPAACDDGVLSAGAAPADRRGTGRAVTSRSERRKTREQP